MKRTVARALCVLLTWMQLPGWGWAAVDIAQVPIDGSSNVKPNIIFAMDEQLQLLGNINYMRYSHIARSIPRGPWEVSQ